MITDLRIKPGTPVMVDHMPGIIRGLAMEVSPEGQLTSHYLVELTPGYYLNVPGYQPGSTHNACYIRLLVAHPDSVTEKA